MAEIVLENEYAKVVISDVAAEIHEFVDKETGINVIWSGDATYWANRNPILFPHIGGFPNQKYQLDGKEYTSGNHGFLRHAQFSFGKVDKRSAQLVIRSNEVLKEKEYPFDFEFHVYYQLMKKHLEITYIVINREETRRLPFEIGLHPAFNVPLNPNKQFEDYELVFEKEEDSIARTHSGSEVHLNGKTIKLADHPFKVDKALFFGGLKSNYVELTDKEVSLRVGIENMEETGFWQPQDGCPMICIEPWRPRNKLQKEDTFQRGKENWLLKPKSKFEFSTYFEIRKNEA